MEILNAIIQGLTEFLPVSSSGHLALYQHFSGTEGDAGTLLAVLLHLGTLLAVFIVYYKTILALIPEFFRMLGDIIHKRFSMRRMNDERRMIVMLIISCIPLLLLLIPVGGGDKLMDILSGLAADDNILAEGLAFLFTGFLLIFGTKAAVQKAKKHKINTTDALSVGLAQTIAAGFAGVSRSGSTIATGMLCGVPKNYMVQYSFILGIPAILAANLVEIKDAVALGSKVEILPAVIGIAVAAVVGVCAIKLLQWLIKRDLFQYFGYYCLALGGVTTVLGVIEMIKK